MALHDNMNLDELVDDQFIHSSEELDYDTPVKETLKQFKLNFENHSAGKKLYMQFLRNRK